MMVTPGSRPSITIRPFSSVVYSPLALPSTCPLDSVTRKVTPFSGVVVPVMYFSMTAHLDLDAGDYYAVEIEAAKGFKLDATQ